MFNELQPDIARGRLFHCTGAQIQNSPLINLEASPLPCQSDSSTEHSRQYDLKLQLR